jgi:hypothetical protein
VGIEKESEVAVKRAGNTNASNRIPDPIVDTLTRLIRRARRIIFLRGLCAVMATAVAMMLIAMALDAGVVMFTIWPRGILTAVFYSSVVASAVWFLFRPLARTFTLPGIARIIESHHPEMQERISSAVELLTSRDMPELRGSEALIAALTEEAVADARVLRPQREVTLRAALPFVAAAAVLIGALAALFVAWPEQICFLVARATVPFANLPNVHANQLVVLPGDAVIARGSPLRIQARVLNPTVKAVELRRSEGGRRESAEEMPAIPGPEGSGLRFGLTLPQVHESFTYRVRAGDALSRYYQVRAVQPPVVERIDLLYQYPEYARMEPRPDRDSGGTIRALAGTRVSVNARLNKPVPKAELWIETPTSSLCVTGQVALTDTGEVMGRFEIEVTPGMAGLWSLRLRDEHGLANPKFERTIQAIPDRPPVARVEHLRAKQLRLSRDDALPVFFAAEDDVELREVAMMLDVDGVPLPPKPLPIEAAATKPVRTAQGSTAVALGDPEFTNARAITFHVRATDGLPERFKGPQSGISESYTVILDDNAPAYERQILAAQAERLTQGLQEARKQLQAAKVFAAPLPEAIAKEPVLSETAGTRLSQTREHAVKAETELRDTARDIQNGFFEDMEKSLGHLTDQHINRVASLSDEVKLTDTPQERSRLAKEAVGEIDASLAEIDGMAKRAEAATAAVRQTMDLEDLAQNQTELAVEKVAIERTPPPQPSSPQWRQAQERIADSLGRMTREMPSATEAAAALTRAAAEEAARKAAELAKEQAGLVEPTKKVGELDKALSDLAGQQRQLANEAKAVAKANDQFDAMSEAAKDIQAGALDQAADRQAAAENALSGAAESLKRTGTPATKAEAQKLEELAKRQGDLRRKTQDLAAERARLAQAQEQGLLGRQKDLAWAAQALAQYVAEIRPQNTVLGEAARNAARTAAQQLEQGEIPKAEQEASRAGENLGQLARRLEDAAAAQLAALPSVNPAPERLEETARTADLAERAGRMAEAQRRLADEMKQVAGGNPVNPLSERQQDIAERVGELAKTADVMQEQTRELGMNPQTQQQSAQAANQMAAAMRNSEQAGRQLEQMSAQPEGQRNPQSVAQAQQASAQALQQAAQFFDGLAQALPRLPPSEIPDGASATPRQVPGTAEDLKRQVAEATAEATRLAQEQSGLAERTKKVGELDKAVSDLAAQQERLAEEAKALPKADGPSEAMKQAARDIAAGQLEQASGRQGAARRALTEQAAQLASETPTAQADAQRIAALAQRQQELAKKTEAVAAERGREASADAKNLLDQQKELAREAEALSRDAAATAPESATLGKAAEAAAGRAAGELERGEIPKAQKEAKQAADTLRQLAKQFEEAAAGEMAQAQDGDQRAAHRETAANIAKLAERAGNMAERQQNLAREIGASIAGDPFDSLSARQQSMARRAGRLAQSAASMQEQAKALGLSDQARQQSGQAAGQANAATKHSDAASQQLAQADEAPERWRDAASVEQAQRNSAQALQQTAQALQGFGQSMAQVVQIQQASESQVPQAYQRAEEASESQAGIDAVQSAQQLAQAAREAAARARAMGARPHPTRLESIASSGRGIDPLTPVDEDAAPAWLMRVGMKLRDWLRLPGELRDQVLQADAAEGPEEYRPLIKRYFQDIAKQGGPR